MKELEEQFVPRDVALDLRKLGFEDLCFGFYVGKDPVPHLLNDGIVKDTNFRLDSRGCFRAPTREQAISFLETKSMFAEIFIDMTAEPKWCFQIYKYEDFGNWEEIQNLDFSLYRTKPEAELECIKKMIRHLL